MRIRVMAEDEIDNTVRYVLRCAESGEVPREDTVYLTPAQLSSIFTEKRLELLHYIAKHPHQTIADIASAVGRDWKSVIRDLKYLEGFGLVGLPKEDNKRFAEILVPESTVAFA